MPSPVISGVIFTSYVVPYFTDPKVAMGLPIVAGAVFQVTAVSSHVLFVL